MAAVSARTREKRGSSVSDKQFAFAVKDGHPVRVALGSGDIIPVAYILGLDDYHVAVIDHELSVHLVHKSVPCITILNTLSMDRDTHPNVEAIRTRTSVFREMVLRETFNQQPAKEPVQ